MAVTPTTQIELGFVAPEFELQNILDGSIQTYGSLRGDQATVVVFMCNHCPFVVHVIDQIVALASDYNGRGVKFIAINSNDIEKYPQDGPEFMRSFALEHGFTFPYLFDESQEVAKAYNAACTPDFSVFDANDRCVYRGQLDSSRPGNDKPNDGRDLRGVLDVLLSGKKVPVEGQVPSIGCNIKWK